MPATLEVATNPANDLEALSLEQLAARVSSEHKLAIGAGEAMLAHVIRCGEALFIAKRRIDRGEWYQWLAQNFPFTYSTAANYIRLARHQDEIQNAAGVVEALWSLRGLRAGEGPPAWDTSVKAEAKELKAAGLPIKKIAERLGVSKWTLYDWFNEGRRVQRRRELKIAREAMRQKERDQVVRAAGNDRVSEAYFALRKAAQKLDMARDESEDQEIKAAMGAALSRTHQAEGQVLKVYGLSLAK